MGKLAFRGLALVVVIGVLGVGSYAIAGGGSKNFKGNLDGYQETPATLSTPAGGSFEARLSNDGTSLHYKLSYSGLEGTVTQAHVHFGQRALSGGISYWLCETADVQSPSASTPTCPAAPGGTVEGDIRALEVIGPAVQGIAAGEFAEIVAAMRAGYAYANVHSSTRGSGEIRAQINDRRGFDGGDKDDDD